MEIIGVMCDKAGRKDVSLIIALAEHWQGHLKIRDDILGQK
jgi:hypothetical protein